MSLLASPNPYADFSSRRGLDRRQRKPVDVAGGAGDRVERPRRLHARYDAGGIGDVDADVARLRSGGDDVVARRKLGHDRAPQHAARADEENAKTVGHGANLDFCGTGSRATPAAEPSVTYRIEGRSRQPYRPGGVRRDSRAIRRAFAPQASGGIAMVRLDDKLARIRSGAYRRSDFIIADAKDPDMGPGLHAVGPARTAERSGDAVSHAGGISRFDRGDRQTGRRRHHADLGLESRTARQAQVFRRNGGQTGRSAPTTRPTSGAIAAGLFITRRRGRSAPLRSRT